MTREDWGYQLRNALRRRGVELLRVTSARRPESLLALHLWKLLAARGTNVVLDVGARVGDYGRWLRRNGYAGRIISFEPVSASYEVLAGRAAADPGWDAYQYALAAEEGEADINVTAQTYFSSFLSPNSYARQEFGDGPAVQRAERVQMRRLDKVFDEVIGEARDPRVFLKMDTQGWDLQVLAGAENCLDRVDALQSEVSVQPIYDGMPDYAASLAEFQRNGFDLSGLFPVNLDSQLRVVEFDCVMVRPARDLPVGRGGAGG